MVTLNRIYTKTGDDGTTALGTGERRLKHDLRVEAYGTIDEANAAIGLARLHVGDAAMTGELADIQNDLFDAGADLATPHAPAGAARERLRIVDAQVERLERAIDAWNGRLAPLRSFVLPAGSAAAAHLHLARTIVRRAERRACELAQKETVNPAALRYLNRLSDYLFVAARIANRDGKGDVLWQPGKNRPEAHS
jgi:cob(I)alamin adenosyltransferase